MSRRPLATLALAALLLAGCSRVTPENYERVEAGMSRADVHSILGKPDEVSGGGLGGISVSTETWKGSKHVVSVSYGGDTVVIKHIDAVQP
ncbi:hypothetical protein [Solimonas sp. SE-A11]|uniref:hypothetical protein n=1 Tax=Solimonas sp. SE-A11 TaxID=3054954 RepID=UPI00259CF7E7|nr:hypothetical protein [Solimonas sp. SE-A11]MDM4771206.1 hypothetical protein [Solimonas sp. SE-A11]